MRRPDVLRGQAKGAAQTEIVLAPGGNVAVKELLKRRASPRTGMNTVGDGMDWHSGEHLARSFSVLFGDAVHVRAQAQRKLRHVHRSALARGFLQAGNVLLRLQN